MFKIKKVNLKIYLLILIILLTLTGCSNYYDLNDLEIINALGISKENTNYTIYISLIETISKETIEPSTKVIKITGENIPNIMNNLPLTLNKKIYLSHLNLLLINDTIKTNELENIINFFKNNQETREDFLVAYTDNIKDILENSKFMEINDLIKINQEETSKTTYTTMHDLIKNYYENNNIYLTNIINDETIKIKDLKLFKNNNYKTLENDNSIFYNYLENKIEKFTYNHNCHNNNFLTLKIINSDTKILKNKFLITNEINIITNDCNLTKEEIDKLFEDYLLNNLTLITNKKITIKNTIRGNHESK